MVSEFVIKPHLYQSVATCIDLKGIENLVVVAYECPAKKYIFFSTEKKYFISTKCMEKPLIISLEIVYINLTQMGRSQNESICIVTQTHESYQVLSSAVLNRTVLEIQLSR